MAYDYYMDYVWDGVLEHDEYPVYYVFKVQGYRYGCSYGEVVARVLSEEQAERWCDYFNRKEVA